MKLSENRLEDLDPEGELRRRLEELGYAGGGHFYEFFTTVRDLDEILDLIREETSLNFTEGDDGHATLTGNRLRITSRKELSESEVRKIEEAVK